MRAKYMHDSAMGYVPGWCIKPKRYGNIAKYILGVPKDKKEAANVRSSKTLIEDRIEIVLETTKLISPGEVLYCYYGEDYPTEGFSVL